MEELYSFFYQRRVPLIASGGNYSITIIIDGKLYVQGTNSNGQLGTGDKEARATLTLVPFEERVIAVACGNAHTAVITEGGKLYTVGNNGLCQLGFPFSYRDIVTFQLVSTFKQKAASVRCGNTHTAVITEEGKLYVFGSYLPPDTQILAVTNKPKLIRSDSPIEAVSCGRTYTAAVSNGLLYIARDNFYNCYGPTTALTTSSPYFIPMSQRVLSVDCHDRTTMIVTEGGDLYRSIGGEAPTLIPFVKTVTSVSSNSKAIVIVTEGRLYISNSAKGGEDYFFEAVEEVIDVACSHSLTLIAKADGGFCKFVDKFTPL